LAGGWTCPEALQLHKFFKFVTKHRSKISFKQCCENASSLQYLRDRVASIRHAAVHRLVQDSDGLVEMVYAAIEFKFLQEKLPKPNIKQMQSQKTTPFHPSLPESPSSEPPNRRLIKFPDVIGRLVEYIKKDLISEVEQFLQIEFS
jgi:hypothetical protein